MATWAGKGCTAALTEDGWLLSTQARPSPHAMAWTHRRGCVGEQQHDGKNPKPAGQEQGPTLQFLESNPKNPVQTPIVNTQGGIPFLSLLPGSERRPFAPGLVLKRNEVSSRFLPGLEQLRGERPCIRALRRGCAPPARSLQW